MQKRLISALLFLGVLGIPTFASAEGGLLKNVTDEVNAVTDEVISIQPEDDNLAPSPDEEEDKPEEGNLLSSTVDSVTDTVDQTTRTVSKTLDTTVSETAEPVNQTVETAVEPVSRLTGDSAAPVTDAVKDTTISVTNTVEKTTKTVTGTVEYTTETVTGTVDDTVKPVTDSLTDDKPLVEIDVDEPKVKVDAGIIDTEVSEKPSIQVDPGGSDETKGQKEVEGPVEQTRNMEEPKASKQGIEETTEKSTETRMSKARQIEGAITVKNTGADSSEGRQATAQPEDEKTEGPANPGPETPFKKMEPILNNPTSNSSNGYSTGASGTGQSAAAGSLQIVREQEADHLRLERAAFNGKDHLYYDQWLNAPPSQPPQISLLLQSI